jgi:hypothetical protein
MKTAKKKPRSTTATGLLYRACFSTRFVGPQTTALYPCWRLSICRCHAKGHGCRRRGCCRCHSTATFVVGRPFENGGGGSGAWCGSRFIFIRVAWLFFAFLARSVLCLWAQRPSKMNGIIRRCQANQRCDRKVLVVVGILRSVVRFGTPR